MKRKKGLSIYPDWVCGSCGLEASGGKSFSVSTFHLGKCGVCGKFTGVTEPRDFHSPDFGEVFARLIKEGK